MRRFQKQEGLSGIEQMQKKWYGIKTSTKVRQTGKQREGCSVGL